jgi:hypothetical protein
VNERIGVFPGTFNPPTVAHLAIARAAADQRDLGRVVLVLSTRPIDKEHVERPRVADRVAVLREEAASSRGLLDVAVTDLRLVADIAEGYDVVIMGADKWAQVNDPAYYGSVAARDDAVARLPEPAIAPRPPFAVPAEHALVLEPRHAGVSSTLVRAGASGWMCPAAEAFDRRTGAWSDPERYDRWVRTVTA